VPSSDIARLSALWELPVVKNVFIPNAADVATRLDGLEFPVVAKVESVDIPHRNHHGGVVTDISGVAELGEAIESMRDRIGCELPQARIDGFSVQEQVEASYEAYLGWKYDATFGPVLSFGSGGVQVEELSDTEVFFPGVGSEEALRIIGSTRIGSRMLNDGADGTNVEHLADLIVRLSRIAGGLGSSVLEADFNPIMIRVGSGEVKIVDMLLVAPKLRGDSALAD